MYDRMFGFPVVVTEHAVTRRWVFPVERFVEYEPKDEWWCRKLGIGHEVLEPAAYVCDGKLIVHPSVARKLQAL